MIYIYKKKQTNKEMKNYKTKKNVQRLKLWLEL